MNKNRIVELLKKTVNTLKDEGIKSFTIKVKNFVTFRLTSLNRKYDTCYKDILFINGCSLPHPQRYRVTHQIQQLEAYGLSCDKVDYEKLNLDLVKYFRGFIFYRCPITPTVEEFIRLAKENNKTVFYDIDDLVFDVKQTNKIKYVKNLSKDEKKLYDDGVIRMGKTLDLCEYAIASTERLRDEMSKHVKEVFINRNTASDEMVRYSQIAMEEVKKDTNKLIIGYLSGTITHNDDFKLIMNNVINILKKYDNVYFKIVGLLDLPPEMESVREKIIVSPFVDWAELPKLIRSVDINLAPLEDNIFNEAKSENKWTEAALVKVPTIASNVGAFKSQIKNNETGMLCKNYQEWENALEELIENEKLRNHIANNAYDEVIKHHTTITSGKMLTDFIKNKLRKNICLVLPSLNVSGGIMVAVKHGIILKQNGYDVTVINVNKATKHLNTVFDGKNYLYVIPEHRTEFLAYIDTMVATMWLTLDFVKKYYNCKNRKYLVQGMETQIYKCGAVERIKANSTYNCNLNIGYITISKWCQKWLKDDFSVNAKYAPNGIDLSLFKVKKRTFTGKIKILIEGNSKDFQKNVDESFRIVEKLDPEKYEIHYLSYEKEPKKWYRVDYFYHKIPHDEVGKIYRKADILLKTSLLESFSYPPLEMMATGGIVVALPNDGNIEYLKDNYNCLMYKQGDIDGAVEKIDQIINDKSLREKLIENGLSTVENYKWEKIENDIVSLYRSDKDDE